MKRVIPKLLVYGFLAWGILPPEAQAVQSTGDISLSLGRFDIIDGKDGFEGGMEFRLPARAVSMYGTEIGAFMPAIGLTLTSSNSRYLYGGMRLPLIMTDNWLFTPHFSAGLFHQESGKHLGGSLEFRSGLDLSFYYARNSYLGLGFYHLSNGNIYPINPGTESLTINYSFESFWKNQ
jgi:hypothetical protein